jgi:hypothetical protein
VVSESDAQSFSAYVQAADMRRPAAGRHRRLLRRSNQCPGAPAHVWLLMARASMPTGRATARVSKAPSPTVLHAVSSALMQLALEGHLTRCMVQASGQDALYPALYAYISNATADSQARCRCSLWL